MTAIGPQCSRGDAGMRPGAHCRIREAARTLDGAGGLSHRLWYDRPVRWQLLATFVLFSLATGVAAGAIVIYNAHKATEVEVAAAMEAAAQVVRRAADRLALEKPDPDASDNLPSLAREIFRLRYLRHVRISILDAGGPIPIPPADAGNGLGSRARAPRWFGALFHLDELSREVPVTSGGRHLGTVLLTSQPADEIDEVWQDVSGLAKVVLIANLVAIGLFYLALGRVLNPLTSLAAGLRELEQGRFRHRLPRPRVRELADIVARFNALAGVLEAARTDNARLNRRLVTVQDDERREIAAELHDELGACLFGLRANVLSVKRLAETLPPRDRDLMRKRVETLVEVSERIQTANRRVLRSICPMAIGHAALADVIRDLVADFERNDPEHTFKLDVGHLRPAYSDCIDLTVYRCVQEGLTNAVRHADAKAVTVRLEELALPHLDGWPASVALRLSVSDDGRGFAPGTPLGLGLTGMERRISALGGAFTMSNGPVSGTRVDITIPVEEAELGASAPGAAQIGQQ